MFTQAEKDGFRIIMRRMSDTDLMSLADTITKKQIIALDRKEAMRSIVAYSNSAYELLRRKKMKREVLFEYADECRIACSPSMNKNQLAKEILKFWGSSEPTGTNFTDDGTYDIDDEDYDSQTKVMNSSGSLSTITGAAWNRPNGTSSGAANTQSGMGDLTAVSPQTSFQSAAPFPAMASHPFGVATNPSISLGIYFVNAGAMQQHAPPGTMQQHAPPEISTSISATSAAPAESQKLAEAFVDWFYRMLNSQNPASNMPPMEFSPTHFWTDASMSLRARTPHDQTDDTYQGSIVVCERFLALAREEGLLFNPNLSAEGVRGMSNPHGLVVAEVCGTLHRNAVCLGIFQQAFGLIRDPTQENNWKVKWVKLEIQSGQPTTTPCLGAPNQQLYLTN